MAPRLRGCIELFGRLPLLLGIFLCVLNVCKGTKPQIYVKKCSWTAWSWSHVTQLYLQLGACSLPLLYKDVEGVSKAAHFFVAGCRNQCKKSSFTSTNWGRQNQWINCRAEGLQVWCQKVIVCQNWIAVLVKVILLWYKVLNGYNLGQLERKI